MSLAAPYQEHYYIGDGTTTTFAFGEDFTALVAANVKCIVYFEDGTSSVPIFTVNTEAGYITISALTKPDGTILTAPPLGSVVRLFRETPEQQNVSASQLQNYTAKQLERIFDAIVAMMQETSYSEQHKSLRLTEPQRDISLSKLSDEEDKTILYWDAEEGKIKTTGYTQEELINQVNAANNTANEAKTQAINTKNALTAHVSNTSNPHQTSFENLKDANIVDPEHGEFLMFDGLHWKNVMSSGTVGWGGILGDIHDQTDLFNTFVQKSGDTMTGTLVHAYGSGSKYNTNESTSYFYVYTNQTEFRIEHKYGSYNGNLVFRAYTGDVTLYPNNDNRAIFGLSTRKWNRIYATHLCSDSHGANVITIPDDKNDTLAVLGDIAFKSTDVAITTPSSGQYLRYDGSKWVNETVNNANTDLSNLTSKGANIANWSSNVSNCIVEIPQDIKLELSSGTLTLKSGSKVYIPNGTNTFTPKTFTRDITRVAGIGTACFEFALFNKNTLDFVQTFEIPLAKACSGTTDTLAGQAQHLWYDTTNNLIKYYGSDGTTNSYYASFPHAIVRGNNSSITSIDQIFNGFGYIGSTIFALPGVKALIPNGRNTDGSLKNTVSTVNTVKISSPSNGSRYVMLYSAAGTLDEPLQSNVKYDYETNLMIDSYNNTIRNSVIVGTTTVSSGTISDFSVKTSFHAVDYNDTEYISSQSVPSERLTTLTLGASGSTYTMPANGWLVLRKGTTATNQYIELIGRTRISSTNSISGEGLCLTLRVAKGEVVQVDYNAAGDTNIFKIVYDEGAK